MNRTAPQGQALPEYGVLITFMSIVLWVVFQTFGENFTDFFNHFAGQLISISGG